MHFLEKMKAKNEQESQQGPQQNVLCAWIVEMKLNELTQIKQDIEKRKENQPASSIQKSESELMKELRKKLFDKYVKNFNKQYETKKDELKQFLKENLRLIDKDTVFQMLQSHGKDDLLQEFAEITKTYEVLISHWINQGEYSKALKKIAKIEEAKRHSTMSKYASTFIKQCTEEMLVVLEGKEYSKLDMEQIMPAFMNIKRENMESALKYIRDTCIKERQLKLKSVHNMQFHFLLELDKDEELIQYLEQIEQAKHQNEPVRLEVQFALNLCLLKEKKLNPNDEYMFVMKKAQVIIYAILKQFDKAVKISLQYGFIDLATKYASRPSDKNDKLLKRKLWMKIAKYVFNVSDKDEKYHNRKAYTIKEAL